MVCENDWNQLNWVPSERRIGLVAEMDALVGSRAVFFN